MGITSRERRKFHDNNNSPTVVIITVGIRFQPYLIFQHFTKLLQTGELSKKNEETCLEKKNEAIRADINLKSIKIKTKSISGTPVLTDNTLVES